MAELNNMILDYRVLLVAAAAIVAVVVVGLAGPSASSSGNCP
jgi:anti-sigma-K factor RskA